MKSKVLIKDLIAGDCVKLLDFGLTPTTYRRELLALGMTIGTEIRVIRVAPMGCPVQIDLRGTMLALRKNEVIHLLWERV